jgi:Tol biopolymer transport system component
MEYVGGKPLEQLIPKGGMRVGELLKLAVQIADALAAAHAAGILHRDLKPVNIMVSGQGTAKVLDFGLAKLMEREAGEGSATATMGVETEEGTIVGTAAYMSPEQAEARPLDRRSDIFSFGAVLYEMATGRAAFRGDSKIATLAAVLRQDPPPLPAETPAELVRVILRCLRKDPARRFQHMDDVKVALEELQEESESGQLGVAANARPAGRRWWRWAAAAGLLVAVVGAAVVWRLRFSGPAAYRTTYLTNYLGRESLPVLSPDGRQVAFSWTGDGATPNNDIYVKLIGAGSPLRLTTDPATDFAATWSPDGRYLAFVRHQKEGQQIWIVPALGGSERLVTQSAAVSPWPGGASVGNRISWSPDGKWIAYADRATSSENNGIFLVSVETGEKKRLTTAPADFSGDLDPAFSPDGRQLAFRRRRLHQLEDVYVMPISGGSAAGDAVRVTFDQRAVFGLDWMPDGKRIVYASGRGGTLRLWSVAAGGGQPADLSLEGSFPSVARGAGLLVVQRSSGDTGIWRVSGPGVTPARAPERFIDSTAADNNAMYSPDGRRVAYKSSRGGSVEIWACDSEGKNHVQVTNLGASDSGSPRWSPDGKWIVFDSLKSGRRDIYIVSAEGGAARNLTDARANHVRPSFSRDGKWIYFGSDTGGSWQIWKTTPEGRQPLVVTKGGGREAFESFDGKVLYFAKFGEEGIWQVSVDGGPETKVEGTGVQGHFAVGAKGLYLRNGFFDFATMQWKAYFEYPGGQRTGSEGLGVSPDEKWVLFSIFDRSDSDLMLVENFR